MTTKRRTTIVTGTRSGMGKAVAMLLAERGERVIGLDVADAHINADLSTAEGRQSGVDAAIALSGSSIDAVIACAGVAVSDGPQTVSVNYFGVVDLINGLHPILAAGQMPRVVVVASSANMLSTDAAIVSACLNHDEALARDKAVNNPDAYASSKLAITRWIRRTAITAGWADKGVLMNGIAPGLVRTAMTAPLLETVEGREILARSAPFVTPSNAKRRKKTSTKTNRATIKSRESGRCCPK